MSISDHDLRSKNQPPARSNGKIHAPFDVDQTTSGIGMIIVDGIRHSMSLAGLAGQLEIFLDDIEIHMSDDGIETLSYNDKPPASKWKVRIEMRANDTCHITPHFHVTHNNECASYDLENYNWLGGAAVDPNTAEMVRRFFVYYGAGKRMASILQPDLGESPLGVEADAKFAFSCQLLPVG